MMKILPNQTKFMDTHCPSFLITTDTGQIFKLVFIAESKLGFLYACDRLGGQIKTLPVAVTTDGTAKTLLKNGGIALAGD